MEKTRLSIIASVAAACVFVLAVSSCKGKEDSGDGGKQEEPSVPENTGGIKKVTAGPGWDIYVAGVYRYGPCIILNADGTMDAWFAAPGGDFEEGAIILHDGEQSAFQIRSVEGKTVGQMFESTQDFRCFSVCVPTYGRNGTEDVTLSIYEWKDSYASSVAAEPLNTKTFRKFNDNDWLAVFPSAGAEADESVKFPSGKYLAVLSDPTETTGCWMYSSKNSTVRSQAFKGGRECDGALMSKVILSGNGTNARFWDQIAYKRSGDGERPGGARV